jgi:predicted extracellular nuclease
MKYTGSFVVLSAFLVSLVSCATAQRKTKTESEEAIVAFYNVENLFDTIDDPITIDEDFTPAGKLQWSSVRYAEKLSRISEVIDLLPGDLPVFLGLCEIENRSVLNDLVKQSPLKDSPKSGSYEIIHADSPDERGIDVAALYDESRLKNVRYEYYPIALPDPKDPNTRDLLHAQGKLGNDELHFFVNHWPSRSGGQAESEPNRLAVAALLKSKIDAVLAQNANAKIVIMGDFNDHPNDKSIYETLEAKDEPSAVLYNQMYAIHASGKGSYFYKGEWGALDQMITSSGLMTSSGWHVDDESAGVLREEKLLFRDKEGVARPSRSYAGDSYKGGYSDHLPVYLRLKH